MTLTWTGSTTYLIRSDPRTIWSTLTTRSDQKVLSPIYFGVKIRWIKIFVSRSFGLTEGHWECEKHAVMLGCLCKALEREDGATFLQNGNLTSERLSSTCVRKGIPPKEIHEDFLETLGKECPYSTVKKWAPQRCHRWWKCQGRAHPRRRNLRSIACEVGISFGAVELILTDILGMSKVSTWSRMLSFCDGQKRTRLDITRFLL